MNATAAVPTQSRYRDLPLRGGVPHSLLIYPTIDERRAVVTTQVGQGIRGG